MQWSMFDIFIMRYNAPGIQAMGLCVLCFSIPHWDLHVVENTVPCICDW